MDQRRAAFTQRYDGRTVLNRKKIKPAPDRMIPTVAHALEIGAREMIDFNLDFENGVALGALKNRPRLRLVIALWVAQFVNHSHRTASPPSDVFGPIPHHSIFPI